jgi:hypothetical protein
LAISSFIQVRHERLGVGSANRDCSSGLRRGRLGWRRPDKPAALQPFGTERHANAVMPENLDQMTEFATKNGNVASIRIAF